MLNTRYPYGNQKILEGEIAWVDGPIVAVLVGTQSYTYNPVHRHLSDIPTVARVATSGTLTGRSATLGVADANDLIFPAVPCRAGGQRGHPGKFSTGTESNSVLIAYLSDCTGLPYHPDGSDIELNWSKRGQSHFRSLRR
jgi:hypothetical protein